MLTGKNTVIQGAEHLRISDALYRGFQKVIGQCGLWVVGNGREDDEISNVFARAFRKQLEQRENISETLFFIVNNGTVIHKATEPWDYKKPMVNSCFNTLYILQREGNITDEDTNLFRCRLATKLTTPPPALLIGVPDEKISSATVPPTPLGSTAPAIILPNTLHSVERHPLPVTLFCGASLESLVELKEYIQCGAPVIIIEDCSELCAILRNSFMIYNTPNFEHSTFVKWLTKELHSIDNDDNKIAKAKDDICIIFATGIGFYNLFTFIKASETENLAEHVLNLLSKTTTDVNDLTQVAELAAKLNVPSILRHLEVGSSFGRESINDILLNALTSKHKQETLLEVLNQKPSIVLSDTFLLRWLDKVDDKFFFQTVIMENILGYGRIPNEISIEFVNDINKLLYQLSDGIYNLFPAEILLSPPNEVDTNRTIAVLATWALLINQLEACKLLAAYSNEPLHLAIVLCKVAKELVKTCSNYSFYCTGYFKIAAFFEDYCSEIVGKQYGKQPLKVYQALCTQNKYYNGKSAALLAFETENRSLLSIDCFKCWAIRLLNSTIVTSSSCTNGLKIILSALLVFPIKYWYIQRRSLWSSLQKDADDKGHSPTVAMLEFEGRVSKPKRAMSMYSTASRSIYAHDFLNTRETTPLDLNPEQNDMGNFNVDFNDSQSTNFMHNNHNMLPVNDDVESSFLYGNENRISRHTPSPLGMNLRWSPSYKSHRKRQTTVEDVETFYDTPVVKLWISLFFRFLYLGFFGFTLMQRGCVNETLLLLVWMWTLNYLCEGFWVLTVRLKTTMLNKMKFRMFDQIIIMTFLCCSLIFRTVGSKFWSADYLNYWYVYKSLQAIFFIYQSYATFFLYGPYFEGSGKLIIYLKNISKSVGAVIFGASLVVFCSIIATKTVVFPDTEAVSSQLSEVTSWALKSIIQPDFTFLSESADCARFSFTQPPQQCGVIGGYGNRNCPTGGILSSFAIGQYLLILNLLLLPLLVALFVYGVYSSREEVQYKRVLQLYYIGMEFAARPVLPAPFTFVFFGILILRRICGCSIWIVNKRRMTEHPDERGIFSLFGKNRNIYRNPSIPPLKRSQRPDFWSDKFIKHWKTSSSSTASKCTSCRSDSVVRLNEKLQLLVISNIFKESDNKVQHFTKEKDRLVVKDDYKPWTVLLPNYYAPSYSKNVDEFPYELRKRVDNIEHIAEIKKNWRQNKLGRHINNDVNKDRLLSSDGLPLNPLGRQGKYGRGNFAKFGSNVIYFYVILAHVEDDIKVLLTSNNQLPSKQKYGGLRSDEYLSVILTNLKVSDSEIQRFSIRSHLSVGQRDHNIAHVTCTPIDTEEATDNAWLEADLWAITLKNYTPTEMTDYQWLSVSDDNIPEMYRDFVKKSVEILQTSD
ncbi:unnamed protein product [Bursaphelenchus okinawaensis]|uniref:Uncharacterized protein n=1 Tax=Bursaphelenchus okinawaensis TaxID=465554 RepID=A0A811KM76_9BILA|nr:unnamed protein product [Bursaphelenchus okinawaensis]CAG9105874.1 unnamed protein product [Bursaphelenchus okinawaensis]